MLMNTLLIDTCQQGLALGIKTADGFFVHQDTDYRAQAASLLPSLTELLAQAHLPMSAIQLLGVTRGPGAFTGLRVGISAAQGLSLAHHIPIVAVSSLQWIAQTASRRTGTKTVLVARDARMQAIYWGHYQLSKSAIMMADQGEHQSVPGMLNEVMVTGLAAGDAWQHYADLLPTYPHSGVCWGELEDLLTLVQVLWAAGAYVDAHALMPVYLRDQVTQ